MRLPSATRVVMNQDFKVILTQLKYLGCSAIYRTFEASQKIWFGSSFDACVWLAAVAGLGCGCEDVGGEELDPLWTL